MLLKNGHDTYPKVSSNVLEGLQNENGVYFQRPWPFKLEQYSQISSWLQGKTGANRPHDVRLGL